MIKQLKFDERRPAAVMVEVRFVLSKENLNEFGQTAKEASRFYTTTREHQAHIGMLQMHIHRTMYSEGMTDESGLCACTTFTECDPVGTTASIVLFSDLTDRGGFHADFDHMAKLLHRVAEENGFHTRMTILHLHRECLDMSEELRSILHVAGE